MTRRIAGPVPAALLMALFFLAGGLSWVVEARLDSEPFDFSEEDSLYRIFGSAKEAVGDMLFLKADSYYHGGVEIPLLDESREEYEREGVIASGHTEAREDWIAAVNRRIGSQAHHHLTREEQKEMLPFFALALKLDPHNIEAVLTTAYWLERRLGKVDEAIRVLEQGSKDNPDAWEMDFELAGIYFRRKGDWARSENYYRRAVQKADRSDTSRHFLVDMHYFLAESLLNQGRKDEALEEYRKALGFYKMDEASLLKDKILKRLAELGV